jgi:dGTPase
MDYGLSPSELSRVWLGTSAGYGDAGLRYAHNHDGNKLVLSPGKPYLRMEREALEELTLAPQATRSHGAGNRAIEEEADHERTCFERDRDRILHQSSAFRKLAGKTQAFVFPRDGVRTRLTHTLEVLQITRSIAQACRLNVPLAEAIALGHDCGHGPGGHASEEAIRNFYPDFTHATFGADVVLAPLNLTQEVLDGVRNHSWSRPAPLTLEGEVVSWADRIAYVCHDFEDAVDEGIVKRDDLPKPVRDICGESKGQQISTFIKGLISTVYLHQELALPDSLMEALSQWRQFNYTYIYRASKTDKYYKSITQLLTDLVEHHIQNKFAGTEDPLLGAVKYVMDSTDKFIIYQAETLLGLSSATLDFPNPYLN